MDEDDCDCDYLKPGWRDALAALGGLLAAGVGLALPWLGPCLP